MKAFRDNYLQLFKSNTKVGIGLGIAFGSLVGLVVGGSDFFLFESGLAFAIGVLAVFTTIFAGWGALMGALFDHLDTGESKAGQSIAAQHPMPVKRKGIKTQPTPVASGRQMHR